MTFALVYGNALADNQRYLEFRTSAAIQDMCETEVFLDSARSGQTVRVQFKGSVGRSPILSRSDDGSRLVPNIISGDWAHGRVYFQWYYGLGEYIAMDITENFQELDLPVLKDTFFHTIRGDSEHILIEFKN